MRQQAVLHFGGQQEDQSVALGHRPITRLVGFPSTSSGMDDFFGQQSHGLVPNYLVIPILPYHQQGAERLLRLAKGDQLI